MDTPRIIIVEDQGLVRDLLNEALHRHHHNSVVALAGTVAEGLQACNTHEAQLLIVGWQLPDGTGLDLVRQLGNRLGTLRVLMLTSNEQECIVRNAAENGVHGFVSKRQPLSTFREAVSALLAGKCFYCPTSSRMLLEAMKSPPAHNTASLTPREWEILRLLAAGNSTREMARRLKLSPKTIANHVTSLKDKLGIQEPAGLVHFALRQGLIEMP